MKIRKFILIIAAAVTFFAPAMLSAQESESGINSGNHGLHLRGGLGAGQIFWGYISHGSGSGDLGTGAGANLNLAAMYNYSFLGLEFSMLTGNIGDLEWTDKDSGVDKTFKSTGTGNYNVFDFKIGAKVFTEPGDMGYTYFYAGKRFWNSERTEETRYYNGIPQPSAKETRDAKGDGWIVGYRDFSTFGWDEGFAIVLQTGFFFGKAPVSDMSTNGIPDPYPVNESLFLGGEVAGGVAFQNIGLSIIGGLRSEVNITTFKDPAAPTGEESVFGFGNAVFFIEAGMMF
jgi:hypothetical protein